MREPLPVSKGEQYRQAKVEVAEAREKLAELDAALHRVASRAPVGTGQALMVYPQDAMILALRLLYVPAVPVPVVAAAIDMKEHAVRERERALRIVLIRQGVRLALQREALAPDRGLSEWLRTRESKWRDYVLSLLRRR